MELESILPIVENIAPGVQRLWTADKRIILFRLSNSSHTAIDAWTDIIKLTLALPDCPNLWIYHFAAIPLAGYFEFTTYLERKFNELNIAATNLPENKEHQQYIATLLPGKFVPLARIIASVQKLTMPKNAFVEIFSSLEEAVRWLDTQDQTSKPHP